MSDTVLCINAGSSSIKFQLFEAGDGDDLSLNFKGQLEGIGVKPRLVAQDSEGRSLVDQDFDTNEISDTGAAIPKLLDWLRAQLEGTLPKVIGGVGRVGAGASQERSCKHRSADLQALAGQRHS